MPKRLLKRSNRITVGKCLFNTTALTALCMASGLAMAKEASEPSKNIPILPAITITGGSDAIKNLPGSAYYIDKKELEKTSAAIPDVNRVLRAVPGVNVQEEDGFGLRPNIGFRGGRVDRSSDITLMEDSVLIAPAPYAAPEAYYFPRIDRMDAVEVRKGSSSIMYGPRTTNGALNLISKQIPDKLSGSAMAGIGSYGSNRANVSVGDSQKNFGYVVYASHNQSDGFKDIDFVGGDTGYDIQDYMGKFRINTDNSSRFYQSLELKLGLTNEVSDETYLGLTTADFNATPYRRYAASQVDKMDADHRQIQLQHVIEPMDEMDITTTIYRNDYNRSWYKLNSVTANGIKSNLGPVLQSPTTLTDALNILKGGNSANNALQVRANNREYYAQGIQSNLGYKFDAFGTVNKLDTGIRYHQDEVDRFQYEDQYRMENGRMILTSSGAPGSESNRIGTADAWAFYVQDRVTLGKLSVTPGLRYETIDLKTEDYGKTDPSRTGTASVQDNF